jgi:hypothetical protein
MYDLSSFLYHVETIEKTTPPDGATGKHWYRYVLKSGNSVMEGKMSGTLKQVILHADELVEQINARNSYGRGRSYEKGK